MIFSIHNIGQVVFKSKKSLKTGTEIKKLTSQNKELKKQLEGLKTMELELTQLFKK